MSPLLLLVPIGLLLVAAAAKASSGNGLGVETNASIATTLSKNARLRKSAIDAHKYVMKGGRNPAAIKMYQRTIGAPPTGKPDSAMEKRIESILGYNVSWVTKRVIAKKTTPKVVRAIPVSSVKKNEEDPLTAIVRSLTAPKTTSAKASAPTAKTLKASASKPTLKRAATVKALPKPKMASIKKETIPDFVNAAVNLDRYCSSNGMDRDVIKGYQRRIGNLSVDGVAGPKTKARVESILGRSVNWPHITAAIALRNYYGKKGRERSKIMAYQKAMGELVSDGIVGPKTKARYSVLTGKVW